MYPAQIWNNTAKFRNITLGISSASIPLLLQLCTAQCKIAYPMLSAVRSV